MTLSHPHRLRAWLLPPLLSSMAATAQTDSPAADKPEAPATTLERVEVTGRRGEAAQRRQSTTAKTVIGRDELQRFGDASVADTLKRLPGVTVDGAAGRGGEIRLRGLGSGYTQILVNGERMPAGFSLDALAPEQIERIEIVRAPTAEFGTQAIAGTINIVLRQDTRRRQQSLTLGLGLDNGRPQPSLAWSQAGSDGGRSHEFAASLFRNTRQDLSTIRTVSTNGPQDKVEQGGGRLRREGISANGRVQWQLGEGESFALIPNLFYTQGRYAYHGEVSPDTAQPYSAVDSPSNWYYGVVGNTAQWQLAPTGGGKLDIKAGGYLSGWGNNVWRHETRTAGPRDYTNAPRTREDGLRTSGKYNRLLDNDHQLAAGWEADLAWRRETQHPTDTAAPTTDEAIGARRLVSALWVQDEWSLTPQWAVHAGLRAEAIQTTSRSATQDIRHLSTVASPLLHALWRPEPDSRNQVRASLTRSYKAPTTQQLVARRAVAVNNAATSPDRLGNPDLLPELATGLDLAYEHYPAGGGVVSAGLFHRRIRNLIRTVTAEQGGRYVSQPVNLSSATVSGLELEAKGRPADWWPALRTVVPALDVRGSLSLFRSRVADVPGPDNTLDRQPRWSGNVGADYKVPGTPLALGGNVNHTPGYDTQQSAELRSLTGQRRVVDAYGTWAFDAKTLLRLSATNLWPQRSTNATTYTSSAVQETVTTTSVTSTLWSLRLELKL